MSETRRESPTAFKQRAQIQTAARLKLKLARRLSPNCAGSESAQVILQFALLDAECLIGELTGHGQVSCLIIAPLPWPGLQRSLHSRILKLRDIAAEFDLQMRTLGEFELAQLAHRSLQDGKSRLPFFRCSVFDGL